MGGSASGPRKPRSDHFLEGSHCSHDAVLVDPKLSRPNNQTYPRQFATVIEASLCPAAPGRLPTPTLTG